jgi:putative endonuclease
LIVQINGATMPTTNELGVIGEGIALQALKSYEYTVLDRNWHWIGGEADIIARHGDFYVFVEVRLRTSGEEHAPEYSITPSKKEKLLSTAQVYMGTHDLADAPWRIDVIAIDMTPAGKVKRLALYQDAVRVDG